MNYKAIEELKGKTLESVEQNGGEEIVFTCTDGTRYRMFHEQDCCESVQIESIDGAFCRLVGKPILYAQERPGHGDASRYESVTFTDFALSTEDHEVIVHWVGESNGYYSEDVYFVQL